MKFTLLCEGCGGSWPIASGFDVGRIIDRHIEDCDAPDGAA